MKPEASSKEREFLKMAYALLIQQMAEYTDLVRRAELLRREVTMRHARLVLERKFLQSYGYEVAEIPPVPSFAVGRERRRSDAEAQGGAKDSSARTTEADEKDRTPKIRGGGR